MTQHKEDTAIRTIFEIINSDEMEGLGEAGIGPSKRAFFVAEQFAFNEISR